MKRRSPRTLDEPTLFDLPLNAPDEEASAPQEREEEGETEELPEPVLEEAGAYEPVAFVMEEPPRTVEEAVASPVFRWLAGLADTAVLLAVLLLLWVGAWGLGVSLAPGDIPAVVLFLLLFSLFYTVIALAFWGKTPGMGLQGLKARSQDDEPVSFTQAFQRWMGCVVVFLSLGLLLLARKGGRSFPDWISKTRTSRVRVSSTGGR
jgi:uncharacterized RDD family membrane protein YckC